MTTRFRPVEKVGNQHGRRVEDAELRSVFSRERLCVELTQCSTRLCNRQLRQIAPERPGITYDRPR